MQSADEASPDHQSGSQQSNTANSNGSSSSPAGPQATSPASVLHGVPNGDAPSMPPPVDPNLPKYRSASQYKVHTCVGF